MAITLGCAREEKKEDYRKDAVVRIGLEKEKRETEDSKRVKRTFRFYLVCGRFKYAVLGSQINKVLSLPVSPLNGHSRLLTIYTVFSSFFKISFSQFY